MLRGVFGVLCVLWVAAIPLGAQHSATAADRSVARYGLAIATVADSVLLRKMARSALLIDGPRSPEAALRQGAQRLVGAFGAVVPPSGLTRLHAQLVGALELLTAAWTEAQVGVSTPLDCRAVGSCTAGIEASADAIVKAVDREDRAYMVYRDARARATRMLADRGVVLPPLELPPPRAWRR